MKLAFRVCIALLVVFGGLSSSIAKPRKLDRQLLKLCRRSERMLDKLDFERARELLEATARAKKYRRASRRSRARLWVLLGRARAELGDPIGSDDAFAKAVRLDPKVKLSKGTSPKIVEALERARFIAPDEPDEPEVLPPDEPDEPSPEPDEPPVEPDEPPPEPDEPPPEVERPPRRDPKPRPSRDVRPPPRRRPPPPIREVRPPPRTERSGSKSRRRGRWLEARVQGTLQPGTRINIIAEHGGLPRKTKFEARIRRTQRARFSPVAMTKTGTVAQVPVLLDRRLELFVVAKRGRRVVARHGSSTRPIVIIAGSASPSVPDAWTPSPLDQRLEDADPPSMSRSESSRLESGSDSEPLMEPRTPVDEGSVLMEPAPPPAVPDMVPPPPVDLEPASGLSTTEVVLLSAGGALLVAGTVVLIVVLTSQPSTCNVQEGFGCADVRVLPLVSF